MHTDDDPPRVAPRWPSALRARLRRTARPARWAELLLTGIGYAVHSVIRNAVPDHRTAALHRAQAILRVERELHISFELALNHAANHVTWLIVGMNYYYAVLHFTVTIGLLLWLYLRRPEFYRAARTALYAATALGLVGFYAWGSRAHAGCGPVCSTRRWIASCLVMSRRPFACGLFAKRARRRSTALVNGTD